MPIIKSAIKRMRQNEVRRKRNQHYKSQMKSMVKLITDYIKKGEVDKAKKIFDEVISAVDTALKKKLIHANNAARKKSSIQKAFSALSAKK